MWGRVLGQLGKYTGNQKYIDDAANQIIHQDAVEQDADRLWFHGYLVNRENHAPFYKTIRADGGWLSKPALKFPMTE